MVYQKKLSERPVHYDLVVCGGGLTGFACALAGAEEGLRVLLLEQGSCLGGVATQGMVNHLLGGRTFYEGRLVTSIGGIYGRLEQLLLAQRAAVDVSTVDFSKPSPHGWYRGLAAGLVIDGEATKLALEELLTRAGVEILYNTVVVDALTDQGRVTGVVVHNKGGLQLIKGSYFADTTGDGDLCAQAGCPMHPNDEGYAPATLELQVEGVDHRPSPNICAPPWMCAFATSSVRCGSRASGTLPTTSLFR